MQPLTLRSATADEAPLAAAIVRRSIKELCVQDHRGDECLLQAWLANKTAAHLRAWIEGSAAAYLALMAGVGHGFALVTTGGELALLYVTPEAQRQGLGKALLVACERSARQVGARTLTLDSTRTARDFYRRNGFIETAGPRDAWGMTCFPMAKPLFL